MEATWPLHAPPQTVGVRGPARWYSEMPLGPRMPVKVSSSPTQVPLPQLAASEQAGQAYE